LTAREGETRSEGHRTKYKKSRKQARNDDDMRSERGRGSGLERERESDGEKRDRRDEPILYVLEDG
jgi:hypothetical protein